MKRIVLVGGGGHCEVVISVIRKTGGFDIVGICDLKEKLGKSVMGVPVRYLEEDLPKLFVSGVKEALVTVGSVGDPTTRIRIFNLLKSIGFSLPIVVSPDSVVDSEVRIGEGTVVMPGAVVNAGSRIGKNCIINTGSIIEHDSLIGDHVHIAPGAILCGGVKVEEGAHIGAGAIIVQGKKVGKKAIVGAGSVVVRDIPGQVVAKGVPAKWG